MKSNLIFGVVLLLAMSLSPFVTALLNGLLIKHQRRKALRAAEKELYRRVSMQMHPSAGVPMVFGPERGGVQPDEEEDDEEPEFDLPHTYLMRVGGRIGRYWSQQARFQAPEFEATALEAMHDIENIVAEYFERAQQDTGFEWAGHEWEGPGDPPDSDIVVVPDGPLDGDGAAERPEAD